MLDFLLVTYRNTKQDGVEIYPKFIIKKSQDLMIRGGDFYAVWVEEKKLWSTDEQDAFQLIDRELNAFAKKFKKDYDGSVRVLHMWDAESGMADRWHKYCQKQMRDNFHMLDDDLIFSNTETKKEDYASKRLPYPLEEGDLSSYERLMSTLYTEPERQKIEWAIGAVISGDSKKIQKFLVLYGAAGTGKSTVLNIIQKLFDGYYSVFDAKALGSSNNAFALEAFKSNPLVAIQHDGDLSRIEDNTRLNSLVSHELMTVNEKFKSAYSNRFKCFLFMGTNKPVRITDAKSGLIRRLIDVTPSGNKLSAKEYKTVTSQIDFELGAIAYHCLGVYKGNPNLYDSYIPINMMGASNDFYNFVVDSYHVFKREDKTTLKEAWEMYKTYCNEAKIQYPFSQRVFKEELKNYFKEFQERFSLEDGTRVRSYYMGFLSNKFDREVLDEGNVSTEPPDWLIFQEIPSTFDTIGKDFPAQYATDSGIPMKPWNQVKTALSSLDTHRLHYVKVPGNHIVVDFDLKDEKGEKSLKKNLEAASKWPKTYAELSKSGAGIHLHYIYTEDPGKLSRIYDDQIEIKVQTGDSSLRRMLTKCNDLSIATISSGLPLKGEKNVISMKSIQSERGLRTQIKRNLNKEIHGATKPSVDFIYKILTDAYESGLKYDVTDMRNAVLSFAANSTNQADYCIKLVNKMPFKSEEASLSVKNDEADLVFYDVEVFQNLFLVSWKLRGEKNPVVRIFNPTPEDIEELLKYRLVGFNNRRYDNHMLYACLMGYTNEQLYKLSQRIISGDRDAFFGEAYNVSYTDIYDFASAGNKKSLKKLEIEMGIHHKELGLPWDKPVPKELWNQVGNYCEWDVVATEKAFDYLKADWTARQILADLAGMTVNDTTNTLTQRIIFGEDKNPQEQFHYRDLSEPVTKLDDKTKAFLTMACPEMMASPHGEERSLLPYFPGYSYEAGVSTYRGEEVGEGGYVYSEPGIYGNVALLDIASMHPHSAIAEVLFGVKYTTAFRDIVEGRVSIKHEAWDEVNHMLDGKLTKYIQKVIDGELTAGDLADALKTAINSVYGLTSASFNNAFRDKRNKDNIVAKRGALFMVDLKHAVQEKGFTVAHIKTDSIKIPDATPEIIQFVMEFGKRYGYTFEHEATYDRMCLVNDAVYIARYKTSEDCDHLYGYVPGKNQKKSGKWTATGKQFQIPYLFKSLFSKEPIEFSDMCETFSTQTALYLDVNERLPDVSEAEKELSKLETLYKKGQLSDTTFESSGRELYEKIQKGHDYHFVGKVGQFTPIKSGYGGGVLLREADGYFGVSKYYSVSGSKGFRWMESEMVKEIGDESWIDKGYYNDLINEAVASIEKYGDYEWFVSEDPYVPKPTLSQFMNVPESADENGVPFDEYGEELPFK